ncbi:hypothetical protein IM697_22855 [Streptomyces ferrugineus]|uniref:Uncharacterized protein n=1 Tax=Streptomyces ferrugineus TaxID=1413221 RepID=A0A7M2SD41_9ACTN|nr:hypothetical protein [Streptomyces ferrugineus]QOV33111.1 hypothetical protein IM697_22855 [Streptomyces ferrugineus]
MRLASAHAAVRRIWTVELRPQAGGPSLLCPHCTARTPSLQASSARSAALTHLAHHARTDALPPHLRTCQCRERGCCWHPRHRGCAGPVLLALTRDRSGRTWRLADTCAACAAATSNTAVVPDTLHNPHPADTPARTRRPQADDEHRQRVREMLTYLASTLPCITSPAARLLAVQCVLRADRHGHVRLPAGLLRGMRLHRRPELWRELAHGGWLDLPDLRATGLRVRLLDNAVLDQAPSLCARRRAAHWALQPSPFATTAAEPAERLATLALAVYTARAIPAPDLATIARLCGHSPQQTGELLDRLVARGSLSAWSHQRDTDEVRWQLASSPPGIPGAAHRSAH